MKSKITPSHIFVDKNGIYFFLSFLVLALASMAIVACKVKMIL